MSITKRFKTVGQYDFVILQGATFSSVFTVKTGAGVAWNLTGWTARMTIKDSKGGTTLLSLTTSNSRITLGGSAGTVTLTITAADTAALTWTRGVYDLELVNGSTVYRILEGVITVNEEVTT